MDSKKQGMKALKLYHKCASVIKTIQTLGYPSREMPFHWTRNQRFGNSEPFKKREAVWLLVPLLTISSKRTHLTPSLLHGVNHVHDKALARDLDTEPLCGADDRAADRIHLGPSSVS